jgi:hypothetical protein
MASADERKGENEAFFRELNERLEQHAVDKRVASGLFEIVCECSLEACTQRLRVTFTDYESIRKEETWFILAAGHADLGIERIVTATPEYEIVEKLGIAAAVAADSDPRDNDQTEA